MKRVRVKICGITSSRDLRMAVEAGADAVGFIIDVLESPRNLTVSQARNLVKETPVFVETVAVTVPRDLGHLSEVYKEANPNSLQIHGSNDFCSEIRDELPEARLICAVQAESATAVGRALEAKENFDAILLDSHVPGKYGGTGRTHDWTLSKQIGEVIQPKPLILAGGLRSENVGEAIQSVKPYAVDVSSGVESSPGVKDRKMVLDFVRSVEEARI